MMEINPKFHASKQLALKTKSVDVNMALKKNKQVQVSGRITFQEGMHPMNEIIRFLMTANLIL
jgi:glycogen synthase